MLYCVLGPMTKQISHSKVVVDLKNNRLEFSFAETITRNDLNTLYTDVRFCVADLKTDFDVISDFSSSKVIRLESIPTIRKIMNYLITNGVREVIRVVQDDRLIYKQFLNLALNIPGYKPEYCATRQDALNRLEFNIKRNGIRLQIPSISVELVFDDIQEHGRLIDISVTGCAISGCRSQPELAKEILLIFPFEQNDTPRLSLKAKVVRSSKRGIFAVQFIDMDNQHKNILWQSILAEIQRVEK